MEKIFQIIFAVMALISSGLVLTPVSAEEKNQSGQIMVYYFHGDFRCSSCMKIEEYTKESMNRNFNDKIQSGTIVFKILNTDEKDNEQYARDYQLYTKSVVVSLIKDGKEIKWKNLTK